MRNFEIKFVNLLLIICYLTNIKIIVSGKITNEHPVLQGKNKNN